MHPQVPAEQRTQRLWCGRCHKQEIIGIDDVAEELGWRESVCPDCSIRRSIRRRIDVDNVKRFGTPTPSEPWNPPPRCPEEYAKP